MCFIILFFVLGWFSCRAVLYLMVILGFMLNYALRVNLTIAIVAMVEPLPNKTFDNFTISENLTVSDSTVVRYLFIFLYFNIDQQSEKLRKTFIPTIKIITT